VSQPPGAAEPGLPQWPRRPQRLSEALVSDLVHRVVAGEFPVGRSLPTEPALCEAYGVSRTVVREAMKALEANGLVEVRQGLGTTVRPRSEWDLLDSEVLAAMVDCDESLIVLDELVEIRCGLESEMAAKAASRLTPEYAARLAGCLARLRESVESPADFRAADLAFHDVVIQASGAQMARAIVKMVNAEAFSNPRYVILPSRAECDESNLGHQEIHDALLAADADRASAAMTKHILTAWRRRRRVSQGLSQA
jgi:GntR family transcriptional regulator, galactonate operon transcriptional repressor